LEYRALARNTGESFVVLPCFTGRHACVPKKKRRIESKHILKNIWDLTFRDPQKPYIYIYTYIGAYAAIKTGMLKPNTTAI
jgi:hypothetical protein